MKIKIIFSFLSVLFFGAGLTLGSIDSRSGEVLGETTLSSNGVSDGVSVVVKPIQTTTDVAKTSEGSLEQLLVPSFQVALSGSNKVTLHWSRPGNAVGSISYGIIRNGKTVKTLSEKLSYEDEDLASGSEYAYSIKAVDSLKRTSQSRSVSIMIPKAVSAVSTTSAPIPSASQGLVQSQTTTLPLASAVPAMPSASTSVPSSDDDDDDDEGAESESFSESTSSTGSVMTDNTARSVSSTKKNILSQDALDRKILQEQELREQEAREKTAGSSSVLMATLSGHDSDDDGLSDAEELRIGSDPRNKDTDGDGHKDSEEVKKGFNPLKSAASDRGDKVVFESPKEKRISREAVEDRRLRVEKVERVSKENGKAATKISGKGTPNSFLTVYIYSNPIVVTVKTDANGNWSYELDRDLEDGTHEVYVAVTDATGRISSQSSPIPFVKTAEAVSVVSASELESATKGNRSPAERIGSEFIFFGIVLAVAFSLIAFYFVGRRALIDR